MSNNAATYSARRVGRAPVLGAVSVAALLIGGVIFWRADNLILVLVLPVILLGGLVCAWIAILRLERFWGLAVLGFTANGVFLLKVLVWVWMMILSFGSSIG